jgi:hypothetical protein
MWGGMVDRNIGRAMDRNVGGWWKFGRRGMGRNVGGDG